MSSTPYAADHTDMRFASLTARIAGEGSDAWIVHDRAMQRRANGEDILVLSIGDPDFETPAPIREAAHQAIERERTHYAPIGGEPHFRAAIADYTRRTTGLVVSPDQVTVFPGAQAALYAVMQCLVEQGDEVITAEPAYVTYEGVIGATGAHMVQVPLRPADAFHLQADAVARAITPKTRALLLNFPHNPTGAGLTSAAAAQIAELCQSHNLWCISDEVYAALHYGAPHQSPLTMPGMAERGILISSLSKSHAMTGWRCGWAITPPDLAGHLDRLVRAMFFGVSQFIQDAGTAALSLGATDLERIRASYQHRASLVVQGLSAARGVVARMPDAGMYVFADVRGTGRDGKQFAHELLEAEGVSVTPGEGFGPSGAGHVRITLGVGDAPLREACARITRYCNTR